MFQAFGCEVKVMTSLHDADNTDHELVVGVEFQGGHFICVTDASDGSDCELTISFMHCLTAKADRVRELQEAVNSVNCFVNPCKCTYNVDDEDGELAVSIHSTGMRIGTDKDNIARLRSLMICCFQMQRALYDRMTELAGLSGNRPGGTMLQRIIYGRICAHMAEIQSSDTEVTGLREVSDMQNLTLAEVLSDVLGYEVRSGFVQYEPMQLQYEPDVEKLKAFRLLDSVHRDPRHSVQMVYTSEPSPDADVRNITVWVQRRKQVNDKCTLMEVTVQASGLPPTSYRSADCREAQPRWHRMTIGVTDTTPEAVRAEGEYMAAEQGLLDVLKDRDEAHLIYWGKTLFASDRYFEAVNYLLPVWDKLAVKVRDSTAGEERTFVLGCCFNALNMPERAAYYLDIIAMLNRLPFTKEYILSLMRLNDPRVAVLINSTRESLCRAREEGSISADSENLVDEFLFFLHCQDIILDIRGGRTEKAREALHKILESDPDNAFALEWLAKLK
jgi:hypothetical protein